jgi:hypothetical protein
MLNLACRETFAYFYPFDAPISLSDIFGDGDITQYEEHWPLELLNNLYNTHEIPVIGNLVESLLKLFQRGVEARVAFGRWFLDRLPELVMIPDLAMLSVVTAKHGLNGADSIQPTEFHGLIHALLSDSADRMIEVGIVFAHILSKEFGLEMFNGTDIIPAILHFAEEGSFRLKKTAFRAIKRFLRLCPHTHFQEFVHPDIIAMIFDFFNDEEGTASGDQELVKMMVKMMRLLLTKLVLSEPDIQNVREMRHVCEVLKNLGCDSDEEIAKLATAAYLNLAPYWMEMQLEEGDCDGNVGCGNEEFEEFAN